MATSSAISSSNPVMNTDRPQRKKIRRKKTFPQAKQDADLARQAQSWKSEAQQQIYSSKLLKALGHVTIGEGAAAAAPRRGRVVRETADRVLAVTAKGRTRWSRAILTNRLKLKFRKHKRQRVASAVAAATGNSRSTRKPRVSVFRLKGKNLPAVQRKVRVLGRLVPGCRKQALPVILEEATDYIPALEMQIRAMSALFQLLSGAGSSSGAGAAPPT